VYLVATVVDMSERIRQTKPATTQDHNDIVDNVDVVDNSAELLESLDDILDHIDEILEENAEEFVKNYVQKGGE